MTSRLVLPREVPKDAISDGTKAVDKYTRKGCGNDDKQAPAAKRAGQRS